MPEEERRGGEAVSNSYCCARRCECMEARFGARGGEEDMRVAAKFGARGRGRAVRGGEEEQRGEDNSRHLAIRADGNFL